MNDAPVFYSSHTGSPSVTSAGEDCDERTDCWDCGEGEKDVTALKLMGGDTDDATLEISVLGEAERGPAMMLLLLDCTVID